jgi:hypothetical protein
MKYLISKTNWVLRTLQIILQHHKQFEALLYLTMKEYNITYLGMF